MVTSIGLKIKFVVETVCRAHQRYSLSYNRHIRSIMYLQFFVSPVAIIHKCHVWQVWQIKGIGQVTLNNGLNNVTALSMKQNQSGLRPPIFSSEMSLYHSLFDFRLQKPCMFVASKEGYFDHWSSLLMGVSTLTMALSLWIQPFMTLTT